MSRDGLSLGTPHIDLGSETLFEGDRVLFTRTSFVGVKNGSLGTVLRIDQARDELTVKLDTGKKVKVSLKRYGKENLRLGYAITTHRGQGVTVEENAYVLTGGEMTDREMSYVQASRARGETFLFTDRFSAGKDLEDLSRQMAKSKAKTLAHDVLTVEREEIEHTLEL